MCALQSIYLGCLSNVLSVALCLYRKICDLGAMLASYEKAHMHVLC